MANDNKLKSAEHPFSNQECKLLGRLAGFIIPASAAHGVPGAGDETIMATFLAKGTRSEALLKEGLAEFSSLVEERGKNMDQVDDAALEDLWSAFEEIRPAFTRSVMTITVQSYYLDPRVLASMNIETDQPFPAGRQVPQGDWSLLDDVKQRNNLYRDA